VSSGGGPNSEIAKLSIGIEATGADATTQKLKGVEQQAKQTAAAVESSSMVGPGFRDGSSSITGLGINDGNPADITRQSQRVVDSTNAAERATKRFVETNKDNAVTLRSVKQEIFGTVGIIGSFVGAVTGVIEGIRGYNDAARGLSVTLGELTKQQTIDINVGLSQEQSMLKRAAAMRDAQMAAEEARKGTQGISDWWSDVISGGASGELIERQIDAAYRGALKNINDLKKNQEEADKEVADKKAELARNEKVASVQKQTSDLELQAELLNASEATKVKIDAEKKLIDLRIAARDEEDSEIRRMYLEQIGYVTQIRDARLKAIEEASMKEMERQKQMAEQIAKTMAEAFTREAKSASESIRDAFRDANTTNYLRDAAASLRAILQQRRL